MQTIEEVLGNLSKHLDKFNEHFSFNDARQIAESATKLLFLNKPEYKNFSETSFNTRIENLKKLEIEENTLNKIKCDLQTLQVYGNAGSHDNAISHQETDSEIIRVKTSVLELMRNIFDSSFIEIDEVIPNSIWRFLGKKTQERENWRCQEIVGTVYPRRQQESKGGLLKGYQYEYIEVADSAAGLKIGFLFLGENINKKKTIEKFFLDILSSTQISSLNILIPKEKSKKTGEYIRRRIEYIEKQIKNNKDSKRLNFKHKVAFIEDYVWEHCLPNDFKNNNGYEATEHFIDQEICSSTVSQNSLDYIENNFLKSNEKLPITAFIGEGGVGKTTFCNEICLKINSKSDKYRKIALLISSYDVNDSEDNTDFSSIQELYKLSGMDNIDTDILELNIRCGNIVIVIDGLDEIESKLKEKFAIKKFIESIIELNDTYNNCSIIITSRNNNFEDLEFQENINIFQMKGFDHNLIDEYLKKRFKRKEKDDLILKIKTEVSRIVSSETQDYLTPLLLHLICNFYEDCVDNNYTVDDTTEERSKYFIPNQPLDEVLKITINREIGKQFKSLNISLNCDDYFEILTEVAINGGVLSKDGLVSALEIFIEQDHRNFKDFESRFYLPTSLLKSSNTSVSFKYDYLLIWVLCRFIVSTVQEGKAISDNFMKVSAKYMYRGDSFTKEISSYRKNQNDFYYEKKVIEHSIKLLSENNNKDIDYKKVISAMMYLIVYSEKASREVYSQKIYNNYPQTEKNKLEFFSIYGSFFPLDFSDVIISNGYFNSYNNIWKCKFPENKSTPIFLKTKFQNIGNEFFAKNLISPEYFKDCNLDSSFFEKISISNQSKKDKVEKIKADITKILRVNYKSNMFSYKSYLVYKKDCGVLKSGISLDEYLNTLVKFDFIKKEEASTGDGHGYTINKDKQQIIKDYLTQSIPHKTIESLIRNIIEKA